MRKFLLHLAITCITFTFSTHFTRIWNTHKAQSMSVIKPSPSPPTVRPAANRELLDIYNQYAQAQTKQDRAFFERVEAEEFKLFTENRTYSRAEDIQMMISSPTDEVYTLEVSDIEDRDELAVVRGRMTVKDKHGEVDSWHWVDICVKRGNRWQILSTTQSD